MKAARTDLSRIHFLVVGTSLMHRTPPPRVHAPGCHIITGSARVDMALDGKAPSLPLAGPAVILSLSPAVTAGDEQLAGDTHCLL